MTVGRDATAGVGGESQCERKLAEELCARKMRAVAGGTEAHTRARTHAQTSTPSIRARASNAHRKQTHTCACAHTRAHEAVAYEHAANT